MKQTPPPELPRTLDVPWTAPPYDDQLAPHEGNAGRPHSSTPLPAQDEGGQGPGTTAPLAGDASAHGPGPAAGGWASQFAQVLAETLAGSRPAAQLAPWTTEHARRRIRQLGPSLATNQRPRVRKVMTSEPSAGILEMTAVVRFGSRVRVLALRLECQHGQRPPESGSSQSGTGWCCTAIESA